VQGEGVREVLQGSGNWFFFWFCLFVVFFFFLLMKQFWPEAAALSFKQKKGTS